MEPVAIVTPTPDLYYAGSAALQLLEQELDELRRARQARRLSMFSGPTPSPPPQFKPARRNSDIPSRESTPERRSKPPANLKAETNGCRDGGSSVRSGIKAFEEMQKYPPQPVDKLEEPMEKSDLVEVSNSTSSIANKESVISASKEEEEGEKLEKCGPVEVSEDPSSITRSKEFVVPESKKDEGSEGDEREVSEDTSPVTSKESIALESKKDEQDQKQVKPVKVDRPSTENKPRTLQRERKPLRIQTSFDRNALTEQHNSSIRESQESTMLLNARRNLKSTPSPPPASVIPSPTKSASALYKLADKRASMQSSKSAQTSTNVASDQKKPNNPKPRSLNDAFIGVKGLSKKFDSTKGSINSLASIRVSKPLLSPESQSVSRERRISAPAVSTLSQLFNETKKPDQRRTSTRQSKPLPPIKVDETIKSDIEKPSAQMMSSLPPSNKKNESLRLLHKTMPAIPNRSTEVFKYPNPLPVYTPQLVHPIEDTLKKESIEVSSKCARKRVSFSSVVTSIPPPSPSQYSDDDHSDTQRKPPVVMSSAHLLSRWQQQHQMDRKPNNAAPTIPRGRSDTRGFWEAFSTEMNNRVAPDLRRVARDQQPQQTNNPTRFIPSTFANGSKPLPAVSNDKPIQESPVRKNKTWINALQNRLAMKIPVDEETKSPPRRSWPEQNPPTSNPQSSYRSSATPRKPVSQAPFDEYGLPRSNTPPLHHVNVYSNQEQTQKTFKFSQTLSTRSNEEQHRPSRSICTSRGRSKAVV
ncbi:hypothetical protein BJV82DRAFT_584285 [Fennellomyces sp. T-0311]|nr:hypothetical protein BJV82DRAFT_584285 [Fennellomyces sp. T-0311]